MNIISSNLDTVSSNKKVIFKKGSDAFFEGKTNKYFYFILSGKLKVSQIDFNTGKEQILYILSTGDMFDILSYLDENQDAYITTVLEDLTTIQIKLNQLDLLLSSNEKFKKSFFHYIANNIKSLEDLTLSFSFDNISTRLLKLFKKYSYVKNGELKSLISNFTHQELANLTGSVRQVITRTIKEIKKDDQFLNIFKK